MAIMADKLEPCPVHFEVYMLGSPRLRPRHELRAAGCFWSPVLVLPPRSLVIIWLKPCAQYLKTTVGFELGSEQFALSGV
jgi:hypothetical protein